MSTLIITVGLPGCGKSTWAREFVEQAFAPTLVVERDEVRATIGVVPGDFSREGMVTQIRDGLILDGLTGRHVLDVQDDPLFDYVISADTNLQPRYRRSLVALAEKAGASVLYKVFGTGSGDDLTLALERNARRTGTRDFVPVEVITSFYERFVVTGAWLQGIDKTARI